MSRVFQTAFKASRPHGVPARDTASEAEPLGHRRVSEAALLVMLTSFIGWVNRTVTAAAEAEMDDDVALREQLLEAEMRRESGEITDEQFEEIEADLPSRIREIRERRQGDRIR